MNREESGDLESRARAGDEAARRELINQMRPELLAYAERRLPKTIRRYLDPADVVSVVIEEALRLPRPFHSRDGLRRDLLARVELRIRSQLRRFARRGEVSAGSGSDSEPGGRADLQPGSATGPGTRVANNESESLARESARRLDPADRELVAMRNDDMSWAEIGARCGCSPDAARMRYVRAIEELKRIFDLLKRRPGTAGSGESD